MIVKVQRAITPRNAPALFYNQSKSVKLMRHLSQNELSKFGDDMKAYFTAKLDGNAIILQRRVDDQGW